MKKKLFSIRKRLKEETDKCKAKCAFCGKKYDHIKIKPTIDHIVPKSSGGGTVLSNLIVVCQKCNSVKKKSLSLKEFVDINPNCKRNLIKYLNKSKKIYISNTSYYDSIKWIEQYL